MLKIRPFKEGFDEKIYVSIFNAVFADYDDIRGITLEEMKKTKKAPGYSSEGIFIAEWDGEPAGMINAYVDKMRKEEKGFIQGPGILPLFRGKGIARKLVEKATESLKQRAIKIAETVARSDQEVCVHIYESFGFEKVRFTSMMRRTLDEIPSDIGENMEVTIRNMHMKDEGDIRLLNRLDNEAFEEHFNFRPRTVEETKYTLFETPWWNIQKWFFTVLNNQPVGYAGVAVDEGLNKEKNIKWGWVLDIGVLKPYRRMGIGTRLMLHSMRLLNDVEMEEVLLYVDDMNPTKAIELYEKLGFQAARKYIVYQLKLS